MSLWNKLRILVATIPKLWVLIGDFNDILHPSKRNRGVQSNNNRIKVFTDRILECGLFDLGFKGPRFTWKGPKIASHYRLFKRFDQGFRNTKFLAELNNCFIKVLPRTLFSDHNPLVLSFKEANNNMIRPFKFKAMWLMHETFGGFLKRHWKNNDNINEDLLDLQSSLLEWNRSHFGLVEKEKKILLA